MCKNVTSKRTCLFEPLLAAGCEVLISGDSTCHAQLFDSEQFLAKKALPKRRKEFTETRLLAHEALWNIGCDGPILRGTEGEPLWPQGAVGTLSHCPSLCVAVVALSEKIQAVGVDVDDSHKLSDTLARFVFTPEELAYLQSASSVECRAAFCAKEAASKALSALDGVEDFRKVSVRLKSDGSFMAVRHDVTLSGQWRSYNQLVSAMVVVPSRVV